MRIKEDTRERKVPRSVGVEATGVVEVGVIGIVVSAAVLGSSGIFVAKKIYAQDSQKLVPENDGKKRKRRYFKDKRHIPIASISCSPSSSESETFVLMTGSSSESSRTSSNPLSEDKSASSPWVAELGLDEGVTTGRLKTS